MDQWHVDVAVLSSQKALALPPGLSFVAMSERALGQLSEGTPKSLYLNLTDYLANQQRGQLPYTPAIILLMQLHQRLSDIQQQTLSALIASHEQRAKNFRRALADLPFGQLSSHPSNAMTALTCDEHDASMLVEELQRRHDIVVAPNGGALKSRVFRISHMGDQDDADLKRLIPALKALAPAAAASVSPR
jgi:aspartate aminotransferase-like enzyme